MHDGPPAGGNGAPGPDPEQTDRALNELLEQWRQEDPEGYAALVEGAAGRFPPAAGGGATAAGPYRQGSSMQVRSSRVKALLVVAGLLVALVLSPAPGWVLDVVSGSPTLPQAAAAGQPGSVAPPARPGERLAPAVPVGGAPPSSQYAFLRAQPGGAGPVTFDPCRPIHYVIRLHGDIGDRGVQVVHDAVASVSAATGLVFVFDGMTQRSPLDDRAVGTSGRDAPVLIAWSDPQEVPELAGTVAGIGGPVSVRTADGYRRYVTGHVYLDTPDIAPDLGVLGRARARAVVMHELGHVVGADHPADPRQLMAAENTGQTEWAAGDRYALAVLGQGRCSTS